MLLIFQPGRLFSLLLNSLDSLLLVFAGLLLTHFFLLYFIIHRGLSISRLGQKQYVEKLLRQCLDDSLT